MEITFAVLLWGVRIAFLLLLYLFLLRAFGVLHRALVAELQQHASEHHQMNLSTEQVLAMAQPESGGGTVGAKRKT